MSELVRDQLNVRPGPAVAGATQYFIGGPPRVGKTMVARAVAERAAVGWASADVLRATLLLAGVRPPVDYNVDGAVGQAELLYPFLRQFLWQSNTIHGSYCLEGVELLPRHVSALRDEGLPVRACFVGNSQMAAGTLLAFAGEFGWVRELGDGGRERLARSVVELSAFYAREAAEQRWPYVDMAGDFARGLRDAVEAVGL